MWITHVKEYDGKPVGETYEVDDLSGGVLVKTGFATAAKAPPELANVSLSATDLKGIVSETVGAMFDRMPAQGKRFSNGVDMTPSTKEWAVARRCGSLKNFKNDDSGYESAYRLGSWLRAIAYQTNPGNFSHCKKSFDFCQKSGLGFLRDMDGKANGQLEAVNSLGGFLVPIEFDTMLIDLREMYGVFRKHCNMTPMSGDTKVIPRRLAGLAAYFAAEGAAVTESVKTWDEVQLTARKLMILCRYSNELGEDAILNIGDDLAGEIAYEFALKEDQCGFLGDGTSTYGGIVGVSQAILNVAPTPSQILGLVIGAAGTGASWAGFTLANFNQVVGTLPEYADGPNAKWYVHKTFWGQVMQKLATAAGGNRVGEIVDGARMKEFLGYEVVVSQVLPNVPANNAVVALFGDLSKACSFGDRRMTSIKVSDVANRAFEQDQIVIRGTERFDIVAHDVGEASAASGIPARNPQTGPLPGPIVALAAASS